MEKSFETEVLTRLAVIENKIDDYKDIKDKAEFAYNMGKSNKEELEVLKEKNKWLFRTIAGAFLTGIIGSILLLV